MFAVEAIQILENSESILFVTTVDTFMDAELLCLQLAMTYADFQPLRVNIIPEERHDAR